MAYPLSLVRRSDNLEDIHIEHLYDSENQILEPQESTTNPAQVARVVFEIALLIFGTVSCLLLLIGTARRSDLRVTPIGGLLCIFAAICLIDNTLCCLWYMEMESNGPYMEYTNVSGELCRFLLVLFEWLQFSQILLLTSLFVASIMGNSCTNHYTKRSTQLSLWIALLVAMFGPLVWAVVFNYGFGERPTYPGVCYTSHSAIMSFVLEITQTHLPNLIMLIMTIVLIVYCCKMSGVKQQDTVMKSRLVASCACAVSYLILNSGNTVMDVFRWYSYWFVARFVSLCLPGVWCLLWVLICKDIKVSALCKSAPGGEKAVLLPK